MSARKVTIEGSLSPSTELARGERRTVALTDRVQRLVDRGFVIIVDEHDEPADAPEANPDQLNELVEPKANASRPKWAEWLSHKGIDYTDDHTRDDLVGIWQASQQS
ncbi:hypothetical protein SEA_LITTLEMUNCHKIN_23 [Gordonia phage LittleMunchkin]|nr:hypothetical protein SEA_LITTLEMUNCHKIN_23 [Gordonia phage LittleMunchkin]